MQSGTPGACSKFGGWSSGMPVDFGAFDKANYNYFDVLQLQCGYDDNSEPQDTKDFGNTKIYLFEFGSYVDTSCDTGDIY